MKRRLACATGLLVLSATTLLGTLPAQAVTVTVDSPSCGTIRVTGSSTMTGTTYASTDDESFFAAVTRGVSASDHVAAGTYSWQASNDRDLSGPSEAGRVTVRPCSSSTPRRPVDGDQDKDGKADVLGIQAGTGNLYYYRMTSTGLASGIKAGSGWNNMVFMQQVNEIDGEGSPNVLVAVRKDGTVWQYANLGKGRFGTARQIGSGLAGYSNFTVVQQNNDAFFGQHFLLASDGEVLHAFALSEGRLDTANALTANESWGQMRKTIATRAFDRDPYADIISIDDAGQMEAWQFSLDAADGSFDLVNTPRQVGHGWGAMGIVTSPGSLNGDYLSDLVARRSDGNLYKYLNQGGTWGPAVKIGQNWNGIRLLA